MLPLACVLHYIILCGSLVASWGVIIFHLVPEDETPEHTDKTCRDQRSASPDWNYNTGAGYLNINILLCLHNTFTSFSVYSTQMWSWGYRKENIYAHMRSSQAQLCMRAMDSSCVFQKTVCQQKFQKLSSVCKLVCLAHIRCLPTVNLSVQSTGCPVAISS